VADVQASHIDLADYQQLPVQAVLGKHVVPCMVAGSMVAVVGGAALVHREVNQTEFAVVEVDHH